MIADSMLKKRLRVFTNITNENENGKDKIIKKREQLSENTTYSQLNFDPFGKCSNPNANLFPKQKEIQIENFDCSLINLNNNSSQSNLENKCFPQAILSSDNLIESNSLIITFPYKISEENIYSVLIFYGEVESLALYSKETGGIEANVKFYDMRSSKKAYHEIFYNFEKLLNTFEREKFSIAFANNTQEIFDKFYLTLNLFENIEEDYMKIIQFIEIYSKIHKLYSHEDQHKQKKIIIKFFNSKEKQTINFILSRIANTLTNKKFLINPESLTSYKILLEKNPKLEQSELDCKSLSKNFSNLDISLSSLNLKSEDSESNISESKVNTTMNFNTHNGDLQNYSPFEHKAIKHPPKTSLNFNKENDIINSSKVGKFNVIKKNKLNSNYKIIYDKFYSGIKKRNTPDEERKKYVININEIINDKDMRTTLMIKNIPSHITQVDLLEKINKNYSSAYNFFYLPIDFNKKVNAGYAFINFKTSKSIINFFLEFDNKLWDFTNNQNKICYLSYARIQGFRSICEHFQKSNIMKQVDEKVKPIIL